MTSPRVERTAYGLIRRLIGAGIDGLVGEGISAVIDDFANHELRLIAKATSEHEKAGAIRSGFVQAMGCTRAVQQPLSKRTR